MNTNTRPTPEFLECDQRHPDPQIQLIDLAQSCDSNQKLVMGRLESNTLVKYLENEVKLSSPRFFNDFISLLKLLAFLSNFVSLPFLSFYFSTPWLESRIHNHKIENLKNRGGGYNLINSTKLQIFFRKSWVKLNWSKRSNYQDLK